MDPSKHILLTIDVEDWFQVENFKPWIPFETWDQRELRVERNVHRLLDLFDSVELTGTQECWQAGRLGRNEAEKLESKKAGSHKVEISPTAHHNSKLPSIPTSQPPSFPASKLQKERCPKATFFVLGWIADRLPNLVREIQSRGHEVASHGKNHELPNLMPSQNLKNGLVESKKHLEDIISQSVVGYRAPSFAISDPILKTIEDCGYRYDSSYNSFSLHGRYGRISLNGTGKFGIAHNLSDNFYELPISNLRLASQNLPFGGGVYFRLLPSPVFNMGIKTIVQKEGAYLFYIHPWELDPEQPRVNQASFNCKFRHYANIKKTQAKLINLIEKFNDCQFITCSQYLSNLGSP